VQAKDVVEDNKVVAI